MSTLDFSALSIDGKSVSEAPVPETQLRIDVEIVAQMIDALGGSVAKSGSGAAHDAHRHPWINGHIRVHGARQLDMMTFLNTFRRIGGDFRILDDHMEFWRSGALNSVALETDVHPV